MFVLGVVVPPIADAADRARAWPPSIYQRLRQLKAAYDPANTYRFGHAIPPDREQ